MADIPYYLVLKGVAGANSVLTLSYAVSNTQQLTILSLRQNSTGIFQFNSIRDSSGQYYSNAAQASGLPNTAIESGLTPNLGIGDLMTPLVVAGSTILYFDLQDTSGASNTITIIGLCILKLPSGS